jgi:hypothetical protein
MSDSPSVAAARRTTWLAAAVLLAALVAHAYLIGISWRSSGLIGQEFRQTQTAISCLFTQRDGYKIDYPTPVLGKPWSAPMEFPLYQWAVAAWANGTDQPIHIAGRWVSVLSFYAGLPALFLLLRRLRLPVYQAWLVLAFILASPIYIFYTRAVLIESMAIALVAWHLYFVIACLDGGRRWWVSLIGAWVFGAAAVLIKITTWLGWMLPAIMLTLALLWRAWRGPDRSWREMFTIAGRALAATVPVFLVGLAWTREADHIKSLNPAAAFLLSNNLNDWNFGSVAMRLSGGFWRSVWGNVTADQLAAPVVIACVPFLFLEKGAGRLLLFTLGPFLGTLMIFTNLYFLHDYYYYAVALFAVAAGGIIVVRLFDAPAVPRWAAWGATGFALILQYATYYQGYYQLQKIDFYGANGLTQAIMALSRPDDVIVIYGDDWASMIPYYSQRRALMIPGWREHDEESVHQSTKLLKGEKVIFLLMRGNSRGMLDTVDARSRDLGISSQLAFTHEPTGVNVYVQKGDLDRVARQIADGTFHGIKLQYQPPGTAKAAVNANTLTATTDEIRRAYFYMMTPAPKLYSIPYDLSVYNADTRHPRFSAHATTELIFDIPAGATAVKGIVGVMDNAYLQGSTKGVAFEVFARKPGADDLLLTRTFLEPRFTPSDRGPKNFNIPIPAGYEGHEIVIRSRPGPTGDASFGWGYIEKISIH